MLCEPSPWRLPGALRILDAQLNERWPGHQESRAFRDALAA